MKNTFKKYYQQIHNEVFNQSYPWRKEDTLYSNSVHEDVSYVFTTNDDREFTVEFEYIGADEDDNGSFVMYEAGFRDERGRIAITGEGDAYKIFATTLEITESFVDDMIHELKDFKLHDYDNLRLFFSASEPSRVKLYNRISKIYEKRGYKVDIDDSRGETNYIIIIDL